MSKILVLDMDGTIADFNGNGGLDAMLTKGFFANLRPYPKARSVVRKWTLNHEVYVLSACVDTPYCMSEKVTWLNRWYPFIKKENILLVPIGTNKAEYFKSKVGELTKNCYLFDDYKVNLEQWEQAGGTAVKCGQQYKSHRPWLQNIKWDLEI